MTIRDQNRTHYRGLAPCDPRHSSGCKRPCCSLIVLSLRLAGRRGPRRGSRLCRSRRSPGSCCRLYRMGSCWYRTMAGGDVRGRVTDGSDSPIAVGWSDRARAMAFQTVPGWLWLRLQTWVALATAKIAKRMRGRATRGGERRNAAVSGHRIRMARLEPPLGSARTSWAQFPGARGLGGSSAR